jgi:perosamine synthetase
MVANYLGVKYAVAVSSGTAALHLSLLVGGVRPNEEVIVPAISFVATANVVRYVGAYPIFIDCGLIHIDLGKLEHFLRTRCEMSKGGKLINKETQRIVSAIIPVHLLGHPIPCMKEIRDLAEEFGLLVVEDAAQALGSTPICKYGDVSCISFNGNKIITCAGGGMVVTNNKGFADEIRHLSTQARISSTEYLHNKVGFNYRLSNLHAALGCAQLEQIDSFVAKKRHIASIYTKMLKKENIRIIHEHPSVHSNYWISTALVDSGSTKLELLNYLRKAQISASSVWMPFLALPEFSSFPVHDINENAFLLYSRALLLPSSYTLTTEEQYYVCDRINEFFEERK